MATAICERPPVTESFLYPKKPQTQKNPQETLKQLDPTQITLIASHIAEKLAIDLAAIHALKTPWKAFDVVWLQGRLQTKLQNSLIEAFKNTTQFLKEGVSFAETILYSITPQEYLSKIYADYSARLTYNENQFFSLEIKCDSFSSRKTFTLNTLEKKLMKNF